MTDIQIFLTIVVSMGALFGILIMLLYWWESTHSVSKIKFKSFKKFYTIEPDRWEIKRDYVVCKTPERHIILTFNFFDYYVYCAWCKYNSKMKTKKEMQRKQDKDISAVLKVVRQDIKNLENKVTREQTDALNQMRTIISNLK